MDDDSSELENARKLLLEEFSDDHERKNAYFTVLKQWFSDRISKQEFDNFARKLFTLDKLHLHNKFFLAILQKCHVQLLSLGRSFEFRRQNRLKRNARRLNSSKPFLPADVNTKHLLEVAPVSLLHAYQPSIYDGLLPNTSMIYGRALLVAWDYGASGVDKCAVLTVAEAVNVILKNLLQAVIQLRRSWLLHDGCFPHSFGQ